MSCPGEDRLLALYEGRASPDERAALMEHLDGCELCQAVLAALQGSPDEESVGRYRLRERLARGGTSELFLAERDDGLRCVVKRLLPERVGDAELARRLAQEAAMLAALDHPNLGKVLDWGEADGGMYLVLEHIEGIDAAALLKRFKAAEAVPPAALAVEVVRQAAAGLAAAHRARDRSGAPLEIIHRDVSPPNLMLGFDGVVRVIDFGMAQAAINEPTRTGVVVGKIAYFAPEQARGERLDSRCDVFALGLVFQELLTGRRTYQGSMRELERDVTAGRTPAEPRDGVWVVPELWALSRRCLAVRPGERLGSMVQLEEELRALQERLALGLEREELAALLR